MNRLLTLRKFLHLTQREMADIMSIRQSSYSMIENGHINLSDRNRKVLIEKLHVNQSWLSSGLGSMFEDISGGSTPKVGVPYFLLSINENSSISPSSEGDLCPYISLEPDYMIDFKPFNDATMYRPVGTSSMSPRYCIGDIVACKAVDNKDIILYGEPYLVLYASGNEFREALRIIRKSPDDQSVVLRPLNEEFDEVEIGKSTIKRLYLIKGKIAQNI